MIKVEFLKFFIKTYMYVFMHIALGLCIHYFVHPSRFLIHAMSYKPCLLGF